MYHFPIFRLPHPLPAQVVGRNSTRPVLDFVLPSITLPYGGSYVLRFLVEPSLDMQDVEVFSFPGWLSLAPPIVAIVVSLWLRQSVVAVCSLMNGRA